MADETSPNFIANLARSGRMRIAAALAVTALVGGTLGVIMLRGENTGKALLFSGLELQEAGEMTAKLDTASIKYTLEGGGSAIFVDRSKVDEARMMLSEQGLPTRGSVGWEIFDKTDSLGATSFVQNINKVRALEGELSRTISSLDNVRAARVHISLPDRPLFQRDTEKPTASVVLGLTGNQMTPEKVRAVRNLVATSVPGLSVDAITVVDDQGRMLAAGGESDSAGGAGASNIDERKLGLEDSYRKKVLEIVENIAGVGAARVQVALDVDFNRVTQSAETYDPDGRVVRSSTTSEHQSSSAEPGGGAQTTVANNVPTGAAQPTTPSAPQSTESTTEETVNYEISKNVRTEVIEGGGVKRLSVAVAVDNLRVPGAEGEAATFQARTPEELARILQLVKSAVGFSEARGDIVTVENIPFARPDTSLDGGTPPGPFAFDKFDIVQGVEIGALLIAALALVFFVLRPLAKGLTSGPESTAKGLPAPGSASRTLSGEHASSPQIALDVGPAAANAAELGLDVARISGQVKASSIKKISEVVASHPDESLNIIRSWLNEEAERV